MGSKVISKNFQDIDSGSVIEQIIQVAALSYDRLPVMEVVFERYALILASALKVYTSGPVDVTMDELEYLTCGEAFETLDPISFVTLVTMSPNDGKISVVLDTNLLFSNLEIMLGGGRLEPAPIERRSFTMIEKKLGTQFCEKSLNALSEAVAHFCELRFQVDSIESNPKNTILAPLSTPTLKVTYKIKLNSRDGVMAFIIPSTAIEPSPVLMSQSVLPGRQAADSGGEKAMASALKDAEVSLTAVLREMEIPLGSLLALRPGDLVRLDVDQDEEASVYCSNQSMFRAAIGQRKSAILAAKVSSDPIPIPENLLERMGGK